MTINAIKFLLILGSAAVLTAPSRTIEIIPTTEADFALSGVPTATPLLCIAPTSTAPTGGVLREKRAILNPYGDLMADIFARMGIPIALMERISECESSHVPNARNSASTATGLFQILKGTFEGYNCVGDRTNPEDNIRCAAKIYRVSGTVPWDSSKACWDS